jgi:hypothetical protein
MEFADEHPNSKVLGIDLSPIQATNVPVNCSFRVDNLEADWAPNEKYDFIHSRAMIGAIKSWPRFISQAFEYVLSNDIHYLDEVIFQAYSDQIGLLDISTQEATLNSKI